MSSRILILDPVSLIKQCLDGLNTGLVHGHFGEDGHIIRLSKSLLQALAFSKGGFMTGLPQLTATSLVVGFDVHKYTHIGVALDIVGREVDKICFTNDSLEECVDWLAHLSSPDELVIGLEDVHSYGYHLAKRLAQESLILRYVPAKLTDRERRHSSTKDKTDYEDAKRVGKVLLSKMEQTLPAEIIVTEEQEQLRLIDLLIQERDVLVAQQTQLKNQLHSLLHQQYGDGYKQSFKSIFTQKAMKWYQADLATISSSALAQTSSRRLQRLMLVSQQINQIEQELKTTSQTQPAVQTLIKEVSGCALVTACKIMAEIGDLRRFESADKLARYGGFAPVTSQSGSHGRLYTDKGGNRRLNRAIHTIALTQIGRYKQPQAQAYYERKLAEGKTKLWALRCLKRQMVKYIYRLLRQLT
jgi:transposase